MSYQPQPFAFCEQLAPRVNSTSPPSGLSGGGVVVSVFGIGFINGATVTIDGEDATSVLWVSSTKITFVTPLLVSDGPHDVAVTNPDDQVGTGVGIYTTTFDPRAMNPFLWLDASVLTQGAGIVTAWPDSSGNGLATSIPGGTEPGYTAANALFNNLPTVDFPAASTKRVNIPEALGLNVCTVVVVGSCGLNGGYYFGSDGFSSGQTTGVLRTGTAVAMKVDVNSLTTGVAANPNVIAAVFDDPGFGDCMLYVSTLTPGATATFPMAQVLGDNSRVGMRGNAVNAIYDQTGSVAHLLVFQRALVDYEVAYLMNGFGTKAGIAIGA